jgi:hypothetical protein
MCLVFYPLLGGAGGLNTIKKEVKGKGEKAKGINVNLFQDEER